jgi:hypothetical protein
LQTALESLHLNKEPSMSTPSWHVSGQYYENCSCDFICLCIPSGMAIAPTKGTCTVAMAFQIDRGAFGAVSLDNLGFIVVARTPEAMGKGNWQVGIVVDERATPGQRDAIGAIASGAAGGPMSALSGLVGQFLGMHPASIEFNRDGHTWSVRAKDAVAITGTGVVGIGPHASEPLTFDYTGHPAADRFALARASESHIQALGVSWEDISGNNNAQYAPFSWRSA